MPHRTHAARRLALARRGSVMPSRPTCEHCRRPLTTCYCAHLRPLETITRVLVLQHPRERRTAIGTARMAHLGLSSSLLRVGLDFSNDEVVRDFLATDAPSYVLFPGPHARDVASLAPGERIHLIVVDGTWWQAKKLLTLNPQLAALPRLAFTPSRPSDYRIRRQPAEFCVSTIEALAETLSVLEPPGDEPRRFESLLAPFRAMVDSQLHFVNEVHASRHVAHKRRTPRRPKLGARLDAIGPRLVIAHGGARQRLAAAASRLAPRRARAMGCAMRPASGERFDAVLAPHGPLAPSTAAHTGLSADELTGGLVRGRRSGALARLRSARRRAGHLRRVSSRPRARRGLRVSGCGHRSALRALASGARRARRPGESRARLRHPRYRTSASARRVASGITRCARGPAARIDRRGASCSNDAMNEVSLVAVRDRREQVILLLSAAYAEDVIEMAAFEDRLSRAHAATYQLTLDALVADLGVPVAETALAPANRSTKRLIPSGRRACSRCSRASSVVAPGARRNRCRSLPSWATSSSTFARRSLSPA